MARVGAPFGIKGWLKLQVFTQSPDSLDAFASWLLKHPSGWEEFELEEFTVNVKGVFAKLKGCDDRTAAEKLVKREIGVPRESLEKTVDGEVFWGNDSIEFFKTWLADPSILTGHEMQRIEDLPIAAARKT